MRTELRNYMNDLLADVPKTRSVLELKEELINNMEERYQDMVNDGIQPDDAYQSVVESMGDIKSLFVNLYDADETNTPPADIDIVRRKRAWFHTVATGLYMFGFAFFFIFASVLDHMFHYNGAMIGFCGMIILCIIPTCMLVYCNQMYPAYKKQKDTVVEEFKEWQGGNKDQKKMDLAIYTIIWLGSIIMYFLISFTTFAWNITWIIFLIGGCLHAAYVLYRASRKER